MRTEPGIADSVEAFLNQIQQTLFFKDAETRGSLEYNIEFYRRFAPRKRVAFQLSGSLVIVLSAFLPIMAAFGDRIFGSSGAATKDLVVAVTAALIAVLSGFNSFFRWDASWRGEINAMLALQNLRAQWEIKKAKALTEPDASKGLEILEQAVERLVSGATSIITAETQEYFALQRFPDSKNGK